MDVKFSLELSKLEDSSALEEEAKMVFQKGRLARVGGSPPYGGGV